MLDPDRIDPAEMTAAKTEIKEAMLRRYSMDGRSPEAVFGAMTTVVGELLGEMIAAAAKSAEHRRTLVEMAGVLISMHAEKAALHMGKT